MTVEGGPDSQGFPVGGPVADTRNPGKDPLKLEGFDLSGASAASVSWIGDTVESPGHAIGVWQSDEEILPAPDSMRIDTGVAPGGAKKTDKFFTDLTP